MELQVLGVTVIRVGKGQIMIVLKEDDGCPSKKWTVAIACHTTDTESNLT